MLAPLSAALVVLMASAGEPGTSDVLDSDAFLEVPWSRSSLTLSAVGARDRPRDGDASVATGALSLRGTTTLFARARLVPEGASAWGVLGGAEARAFTTDLSVVDGAARFYRFGASLGGFYRSLSRNVYAIRAGAFVAEQEGLLESPRLRPYAVGLGTLRASDTVTLLYGLGYTYSFGRGLPLPFVGVDWRWDPAWRLDVLLPVAARVVWTARDDLSLAAGLAAAGDLFRYRSSEAGAAAAIQVLRIARLRLGVAARHALSRQWNVGLAAGVEGASIDTGLSTRRAGGGYLEGSVGFGSSWMGSSASETLENGSAP